MSVRLELHDQEFLKMVANATSVGIVRATTQFKTLCQLALNVPNTGVRAEAKSVQTQAAKQLGQRSKGLIKVTTQRKWTDNGTKHKEDVSGWYWYDAKNFTDRVDNSGKVRSVKSVTIYPYPSKPGEAPRKRTGWLQRHVIAEFDNQQVGSQAITASRTGVGQNAIYGLYQELGTRRMQARPWLVATLMKNKGIISQLLQVQT